MDASTISLLVEQELNALQPFSNFHGIAPDNVRSFLVTPFPVYVDPDDLETPARTMWVVLQERSAPSDGYIVVYDSLQQKWGVAERQQGKDYILVVSATSLAGALDGM